MFEKLTFLASKYEQLATEMGDPAVQADNAKFRAHSKTVAEMQPLVDAFREYKRVAGRDHRERGTAQGPRHARAGAGGARRPRGARATSWSPTLKLLLVPKDPNDDKNVHPRDPRRHRRRRGGAVRRRAVPHVPRYAERQRLEDRGHVASASRDAGGIKEVVAIDRRARRLQPAQVRERRASRAARAGDRGAGPHPHLDGDGGGAARGRRGRRRRSTTRTCAIDTLLLERPRRPERQHDRLGGAHHPPADRHSW